MQASPHPILQASPHQCPCTTSPPSWERSALPQTALTKPPFIQSRDIVAGEIPSCSGPLYSKTLSSAIRGGSLTVFPEGPSRGSFNLHRSAGHISGETSPLVPQLQTHPKMGVLRQQSDSQLCQCAEFLPRSDSVVPLLGSCSQKPLRTTLIDKPMVKLQQQVHNKILHHSDSAISLTGSRSQEPSKMILIDNPTVKIQQVVNELRNQMEALSARLDTSTSELRSRFHENQTDFVRLCGDLEMRLTHRLNEIQSESCALVHAAKGSWREELLSLSSNERLVAEFCDEVIARVNADLRVSQLVESQEALQDAYAKLASALDRGQVPAASEEGHHKNGHDKDMLEKVYDLMLATAESCKSVKLEMRQIRQQRNQDCTDNALRMQNLECEVRALCGNLEDEHDSMRSISNPISELRKAESCLPDKSRYERSVLKP